MFSVGLLRRQAKGSFRYSATPTLENKVDPPSDDELYYYLSRTPRLAPFILVLCYLPLLVSMVMFMQKSPTLWVFYPYVFLLLISSAVSALTSNQKHRVSRDSHELQCLSYLPENYPSVDVYLPTCGEDIAVLSNTFLFASNLKWHGDLNIYVLDDSSRPEVKQLASQYQLHYINRADAGYMKKSGNLRHAFAITSGDYILVLDADFAVRFDALHHLIPYFEDEKIGIVQSPQFFDVTKHQNWLQRSAGATQDLFYRWIQPSRDNFSAAICVGTNAIYRRSALDDAGGFCSIEHSEDVHTGVKLREVGYRLVYVPVILAKGLCPNKLQNFVTQQYRWAAGSLSLLNSEDFHKSASQRPLRETLSYFSGFLYYVTTAISVFVAPLPAVIMMYVYTDDVSPKNYLPLIGAVLSQFLLMPLLTNFRYRFSVMRVQIIYSVAHFQALIDTFRNNLSGWVATGATEKKNVAVQKILNKLLFVSGIYVPVICFGVLKVATSLGLMFALPSLGFLLITIYLNAPIFKAAFESRFDKGE